MNRERTAYLVSAVWYLLSGVAELLGHPVLSATMFGLGGGTLTTAWYLSTGTR